MKLIHTAVTKCESEDSRKVFEYVTLVSLVAFKQGTRCQT